jgi:hypothetical protein
MTFVAAHVNDLNPLNPVFVVVVIVEVVVIVVVAVVGELLNWYTQNMFICGKVVLIVAKQVLRLTILSSTIVSFFFDNWRIGRFYIVELELIEVKKDNI